MNKTTYTLNSLKVQKSKSTFKGSPVEYIKNFLLENSATVSKQSYTQHMCEVGILKSTASTQWYAFFRNSQAPQKKPFTQPLKTVNDMCNWFVCTMCDNIHTCASNKLSVVTKQGQLLLADVCPLAERECV